MVEVVTGSGVGQLDPAVADPVQDALGQACQKLDSFTWQGWEALQAWLWSFVVNAHADRCRYHARHCRDERRVIQEAYGFDHLPTEDEVAEVSDRWRPYRSLAVYYLFASEYQDTT